jgi:aconitate hydratase
MFKDTYEKIEMGSSNWQSLEAPSGKLYPWDEVSTYIKHPPFFETMTRNLPEQKAIRSARVLLNLGDSITTDHISPAGSIARNSPAGKIKKK